MQSCKKRGTPSAEQERLIALYQEDQRRQQGSVIAGQDVVAHRTQLLARLERLQHLYELGDWTREMYLKAQQATHRELDALPAVDVQAQGMLTAEALAQLGTYVRQIGYAWCDADLAQRRLLLRTLFSQFWVAGDQIVAVEPVERFFPFFRLMRLRVHEHVLYGADGEAPDGGSEDDEEGNESGAGQENTRHAVDERHGQDAKVQSGGPDGGHTGSATQVVARRYKT